MCAAAAEKKEKLTDGRRNLEPRAGAAARAAQEYPGMSTRAIAFFLVYKTPACTMVYLCACNNGM